MRPAGKARWHTRSWRRGCRILSCLHMNHARHLDSCEASAFFVQNVHCVHIANVLHRRSQQGQGSRPKEYQVVVLERRCDAMQFISDFLFAMVKECTTPPLCAAVRRPASMFSLEADAVAGITLIKILWLNGTSSMSAVALGRVIVRRANVVAAAMPSFSRERRRH
jgi:hypothetical protein